MKDQLRELNENYGPFHVFWFDGEWETPWTHEMGVDQSEKSIRLILHERDRRPIDTIIRLEIERDAAAFPKTSVPEESSSS